MRAVRERERRGLRRLTIDVSEDGLLANAPRGDEDLVRADQDLPQPGHSTMAPKTTWGLLFGRRSERLRYRAGFCRSGSSTRGASGRAVARCPNDFSAGCNPTSDAVGTSKCSWYFSQFVCVDSAQHPPALHRNCPSCRVTRAGASTWLARGNAAMAFVPRYTVRQRPAHRRNRARGRRLARVPCRPPRVRARFLQCG